MNAWAAAPDYKIARATCEAGPGTVHSLLVSDWLTSMKLQSQLGKEVPRFMTTWLIEAIFEGVREGEFSEAVSRLQCCYLWETIYDARWFNAKHYRESGLVYKCLVDGDQASKRLDMTHFDRARFDLALSIEPQLEATRALARAYYGKQPSDAPHWEILARDPVRIAELMS